MHCRKRWSVNYDSINDLTKYNTTVVHLYVLYVLLSFLYRLNQRLQFYVILWWLMLPRDYPFSRFYTHNSKSQIPFGNCKKLSCTSHCFFLSSVSLIPGLLSVENDVLSSWREEYCTFYYPSCTDWIKPVWNCHVIVLWSMLSRDHPFSKFIFIIIALFIFHIINMFKKNLISPTANLDLYRNNGTNIYFFL